jgi:hypothetical protein
MNLFLKDPDAALDYSHNWAAGYLGSKSITGSNWQVLPVEAGGITIASSSFTATTSTVTLAGGLPGHVYRISNRVTLNDGTSDDRALVLRVEAR